jgi:glycosyltransferase involved in cell wall biosynthesis
MANILERLDESRFEPIVCVQTPGGKIYEELISKEYQVLVAPFTIPVKPYNSLLKRAKLAADRFKPLKADLWHSFHYADDYSEPIIAKLAGAHGWVYTKKAMGWGSRAWKIRSFLADRIVADNQDMPQLFFNSPLFRNKVSVIHHGVNLDEFHPTQVKDKKFSYKLDLSETKTLIGCVAHLVPVKGHPTLIEAVSRLEGAHLFLAGKPMDEEYTRALHEQSEVLGVSERVHFMNGVEDVPAFLAEMEIAVLPTWNKWRKEGCPVALLEAMACGKACVATDVPGSRDIIEDGVSGLLVEPENAVALAAAIQRLIDDPELRESMGKAAHFRIEEHFSIEQEVAAHERLYEEIMSGKGRKNDR